MLEAFCLAHLGLRAAERLGVDQVVGVVEPLRVEAPQEELGGFIRGTRETHQHAPRTFREEGVLEAHSPFSLLQIAWAYLARGEDDEVN